MIEGAGAGGITALARASVNDRFCGKQLTVNLSYTAIAASLASMISPIFGGWIQSVTGWRMNFYFLTVYTLVLMVLVVVYFQDVVAVRHTKSSITKVFGQYHALLRDKQFVGYVLAGSIAFSGITSYYVASPFLFQHQLHITPSVYGYLFLLTSGGFISGSLVNKWLESVQLRFRLGVALLVLSALILSLLSWHIFTLWSVVLPVSVYTFAVGIVYPSCMACAVSKFKQSAGAAAAVMGCGQICGAGVATAIMANLPQQTPFALAVFVLLLSLIVFILLTVVVKGAMSWR